MFWNPEVITTTGKSLRITQIQFNIIYIMRTNAHLPEKKIFKLPDTRKNKPPQLTKPRHRLLDSVMRDKNNQFHQQASKPPERLTSCAVRLDDCHENPALQGARCAVPRTMKSLPGIGGHPTKQHETSSCRLPCLTA
ncbi:hypothetical protein HEL88_013635 [Escherichia coli]|nr:hypothetical protein [Escherichia coli]